MKQTKFLTSALSSRWEIDIDGVFLDGQHLPKSTIQTLDNLDSTRTSALIDTVRESLRVVFENILLTRGPHPFRETPFFAAPRM